MMETEGRGLERKSMRQLDLSTRTKEGNARWLFWKGDLPFGFF